MTERTAVVPASRRPRHLPEQAQGGGYVLMSSNSIHSTVRPENLKAMWDTTREFGQYPFDMAALA